MDECTRRMILLGRQAPPRKLDLRLEPRTYVSPSHAPVDSVPYRVEKYLSNPNCQDAAAVDMAEKMSEETHTARATRHVDLKDFQRQVKQRAAKIQKQLRMVKLQQAKELNAKQAFAERRKEYARRVEARNSEHFQKLKQDKATEAAEASTDADSEWSDEGSISEHAGVRLERSPAHARASAGMGAHRTGFPASSDHQATLSPPPADRVRVERHALLVAGSLGQVGLVGKQQLQDAADLAGPDEPAQPPEHVRQHMQEWQQRRALFGSAGHVGSSTSPPFQPIGARPVSTPSPSAHTHARAEVHSAASASTQPSPSEGCLHPEASPSADSGPVSSAMNGLHAKEAQAAASAGGGDFVAGAVMHDVTNIEGSATAGSCGSPPPAPEPFGVPTVVASRMSGKAKAGSKDVKATSDGGKLSPAMHALLQEKVEQMGIELPALCMCHNVPVLDSSYPFKCCVNCVLHRNQDLYYDMLRCLLYAYGVIL